MGKFSEVAEGVRARRPLNLPLPGATVDGETGEWIGPVVPLHIRALNEGEYGDMLAGARAYAKKKGVDDPSDGDPLYDRGKMIHTLALACVDKDSPEASPQPFFEGGVEEILKSRIMTPEVIGYLYDAQVFMQDDIAPMQKELTPAQFMAGAITTAKGNMAFFVNSRPVVQWSFLRSLASLHIASLENKSPSSWSSEPPTTSSE